MVILMSKNQKVFISGNFNVLHPGHLRLIRFAKELGGHLMVAVKSDRLGGKAVHIPEDLRVEGVRANLWVDEVVLIDEPVGDYLRKIRPDIVVKGKEYESQINEEQDALDEYGGKLVFSSGELLFSSLDLIHKDLAAHSKESLKIPQDFLARRKIDTAILKKEISKLSGVRVCVIGDLIIDEYITCDPLGMSREDPTIVVTPIDSKKYIGGAGIVAAHVAALGGVVSYIGVTGADDLCDYAKDALRSYGVDFLPIVDDSRPTTLKQRYRARNKTLLRVSHLHQTSIDASLQDEFYKAIEEKLENVDLLVFSDFNYGCLPQPLVNKILEHAKEKTISIVADSQSSSQNGDISRFHGVDLIMPTEHEARTSLRNNEDGLVVIAEKIKKSSNAKYVIVKLAEEGAFLNFINDHLEDETDRLPALNLNPIDVAGAGDSMLAVTAMSLAASGNPWVAVFLGSLAASLQVGQVGNLPINREMLLELL